MKATTFFWLAGALALSACGSDTEAVDDTQIAVSEPLNAESAVQAIEKSWWSGSAEEAMQYYADDAVLFSTGQAEPIRDRNKVASDLGAFFTMNPDDFTIEDRTLQELDRDTAVWSGIVRFTADVGAGRDVLSARFTQVLHRMEDGSWKIVHEHMSIPPASAG